jgi:hypothetical protein
MLQHAKMKENMETHFLLNEIVVLIEARESDLNKEIYIGSIYKQYKQKYYVNLNEVNKTRSGRRINYAYTLVQLK